MIRNAYFERDVAAPWRDTAARTVPLVIREDAIDDGLLDVPHCHIDFFALYLVRQGRGTHIIDGIPYGVARGDVYAMGLGATHTYSQCEALVLDALYFAPGVFDPPTLDALAETPGFQSLFVAPSLRQASANGEGSRWLHLTPDAYETVAEMVAELRREWSSDLPVGPLLTRGLFLRLLVHLARRHAESRLGAERPAPVSLTQEATVAAAVRLMDERFAEPLRIEQVAASVFLSPDRFTEVFAQTMGRTPRDYLRHLRVERAKALLTSTDASVSEVGQQAGFDEAAYFTRVFRAATGMTPREYRRQA